MQKRYYTHYDQYPLRKSVKEVRKKFPDFDPAPCFYHCNPDTSVKCRVALSCPTYQAWARRTQRKIRMKVEARMQHKF